jgi:hypothetical protein
MNAAPMTDRRREYPGQTGATLNMLLLLLADGTPLPRFAPAIVLLIPTSLACLSAAVRASTGKPFPHL